MDGVVVVVASSLCKNQLIQGTSHLTHSLSLKSIAHRLKFYSI